MAKRFTDSEKWKREWFLDLPVTGKLAWIYLLDQCDHTGVWPSNFKLMSFQLGQSVNRADFETWFKGKAIPFDADKYYIPSFVEYQYGKDLNPANNAHKAVIEVKNEFEKLGAHEGLNRPLEGAQDKDKDKYKDKDLEKGGAGGNIAPSVENAPAPTPQLVTPPAPNPAPQTSPVVPHLEACVRTWQSSLDALNVPRKVTEFEKQVIARALIEPGKYGGVEQIDLALYGARHEPAGEGYDPKDYADAARVLLPNKRGQTLFTKFVGWGASGRAKAQAKHEKPKAVLPVEGEAPPADVVSQYIGIWSKSVKAMPKPSEESA